MIKTLVGRYKVVESVRFLLPEAQQAILNFEISGEQANLRIVFEVDESDGKKDQFGISSDVDPEDADRGLITFTNWNCPRQISEPLPFLSQGDKKFYCMASACYNEETYDVFLQFMEDA